LVCSYELLLLLLLHCAVEVVALKSRQPNPSRPSIYPTWMWRRTDIYRTRTYRRSQEVAAVERRYGAIKGHLNCGLGWLMIFLVVATSVLATFRYFRLYQEPRRFDRYQTNIWAQPRARTSHPLTATIEADTNDTSKVPSNLRAVKSDIRCISHSILPNRDIYVYPAWGLRISRAWKSNCVLGAVIPASQDDIKYLIGQN
jgi:hypothetical protein